MYSLLGSLLWFLGDRNDTVTDKLAPLVTPLKVC